MSASRIIGSALIILSELGLTQTVLAQQFDKTLYIGGGALVSELEPRVNRSDYTISNATSFGGQLFIGGDLARHFSVEGYYRYLGESELTRDSGDGAIEYQTAGINGLLYLFSSQGNPGLRHRTGLMLYGRAGVGYLENKSDDVAFVRLQNDHFSTGVGVEYGFKNGLGLRAEFLNHDADARDISFSLVKRLGRKGELDLTSQADVAVMPKAPAEVVLPPEEATELVPTLTAPSAPPPPAPPPPPPAPKPDTDNDGVVDEVDRCENTDAGALVDARGCSFVGILKGLTFTTGSADLTAEAMQTLDQIASALTANPNVKVAIESHTDNSGSAQLNMDLSRRRAESVVRYLAESGGIDLDRMSAVGYGESRPVLSNRTAEGRRANRRVDIVVQ